MKHEGIGYLDDQDIFYYFCHSSSLDYEAVKNKWYCITCILRIDKLTDHKNKYFVPNNKLDFFLRNNPEQVIDIEEIAKSDIDEIIKKGLE